MRKRCVKFIGWANNHFNYLGFENALEAKETTRTANLRTKIMDFRGFDSSTSVSMRSGIPRPTGNFPEMLNQQI